MTRVHRLVFHSGIGIEYDRLSVFVFRKLCFTIQAKVPVNTQSGSTHRATPPFLFISYELIQTLIFNKGEVFNHAHAIFRSISLIKIFESGAWIFAAIKAKSRFSLS
jgi:hypothetical protein